MFAPAATAAPLAPDAKPPAAAAPTAPDIRERTLSVRTMRSKGGLDYTIFISAPKGPPPPGGFPVLYVVDGNAWFGLAAEVARLNEIEGGPSIVVGVGYAVHTLYDDARRNQDFTVGPPPAPPPGSAGAHYGGAPAFIDFLRHDLRDAVGKAYKIDPARQSLFGHSLGGWFALHVLFTAPDAFSTVVVASPAIWWDDKTLMAEEQAFAAKPPKNPPKVLITIGGFEQQLGPADTALMTKMYALNPAAFHGATLDQALAAIRASQAAHRMVDRAREMADLVRAAGVPADFAVFDGENHRSEVPAALSRALPLTLKSP
jgi:predicted alpha/beta superfamily hydrolase